MYLTSNKMCLQVNLGLCTINVVTIGEKNVNDIDNQNDTLNSSLFVEDNKVHPTHYEAIDSYNLIELDKLYLGTLFKVVGNTFEKAYLR